MREKPLNLNFTKRAIEGLDPGAKKRLVYHDAHAHGLCLRVEASGHKSFVWFRKVNGRPTFKHIGKFPDISVENARTKAAELNSKFARWKADAYDGDNPFEKRRDLTLSAVLEDYLARHLQSHAKNPDRATKDARWQFERYLSRWKNRRLGSVRRQDVIALHGELGERSGHVTANRTVTFLRTLYNWALNEMSWSGENPVKLHFKFFAEQSRTRFLQPDELARLFTALRDEPNRDVRDFVIISLFTGVRRSDTLAMRWENVSFETTTWLIPNPKSRVPYLVPLLPEALEILKERRESSGESPWVFPGKGRTGHLAGLKRGWKSLLARAKISQLRVHDLRRTLGSWMATGGSSLPIIGKMLGHQSTGATAIYARLDLNAVRQGMQTAARAMLGAGEREPETKPRRSRRP
jgi:integrase